eukprot:CAMPEP_0176113668 /NCGR_PEP_ID=MMETSP0120_2-20121206/57082_1 /TAXON_ID=160619 /ORGANISM="Kryptoperidinium foliaceum, Strain CCMP 1326" /LENGTH=165 /DNA_ID=CAMNT_0017447897 /DNA_START=125 /DNA_END=620 /DNA_ORIENTATION=+
MRDNDKSPKTKNAGTSVPAESWPRRALSICCPADSRHVHDLHRGRHISVPHDGDVHAHDSSGRHPAEQRHSLHVVLRDLHGVRRHDLLPADQHMQPEHNDARGVQQAGAEVLEELHFARVQVAHAHQRDALVRLIEHATLEEPGPSDEVLRGAQHRVLHLRGEAD